MPPPWHFAHFSKLGGCFVVFGLLGLPWRQQKTVLCGLAGTLNPRCFAKGKNLLMSTPAQWTIAIIGIGLALTILVLVRRDRLQVHYALWWFFVATAALFFSFFPRVLDDLGAFLGIHYPPILLVIISLALLFIKSLTQDLDRCRREQNMRRLAQKVAMLEATVERAHTAPSPLNAVSAERQETEDPD